MSRKKKSNLSRKTLVCLSVSTLLPACAAFDVPIPGEEKKPPEGIVAYDWYSGGTASDSVVNADSSAAADSASKETVYGNSYNKVQDFRHPVSGKTVRLIGMTHIAEPEFYRAVEKEVADADIVLLEGVSSDAGASCDQDPVQDIAYNYIFSLYEWLQDKLAITDQDSVNWGPRTLNADLSVENLRKGEILIERYKMVAVAGGIFLAEPILFSFDMVDRFGGFVSSSWRRGAIANWRLIVGGEEEEDGKGKVECKVEPVDLIGEGIILHKRNQHLMSVFDQVIQKDEIRSVVIPWGARHNPELETMLLARGYQKTACHWLKCIGIRDLAGAPAPSRDQVRIPYLFSYNDFGEGGRLKMLCEFVDVKCLFGDDSKWMADVGYGNVFTVKCKNEGVRASIVPNLFRNGVMSAGYGHNSEFSVCSPLLGWQSDAKANTSAIELSPLFYFRQTADTTAFTFSPLLTRFTSADGKREWSFDPYHCWPLLNKSADERSTQILWPLLTLDDPAKNSGRDRVALLQSWLADYQSSPGYSYASVLRGLLFESKQDGDCDYFRIFNLYSHKVESGLDYRSILWPLFTSEKTKNGRGNYCFPFGSYSTLVDKDGKEVESDFSVLPRGMLCYDRHYSSPQNKVILFCDGVNDDDLVPVSNERSILGGGVGYYAKTAGDGYVFHLLPYGFLLRNDVNGNNSSFSSLWAMLFNFRETRENGAVKTSCAKFLLDMFGTETENGKTTAYFAWLPVWSWGDSEKAAETK